MAADPGIRIRPLPFPSLLTSIHLRLFSRLRTKFAVVGTGSARQLLISRRVWLQSESNLIVARELGHGDPHCCTTSGPDPAADVDSMDRIDLSSRRIRSVPIGWAMDSRSVPDCHDAPSPCDFAFALLATPFLPQNLDFLVL